MKKLSGTIDGCGTAWVVRYVDAMAEIERWKQIAEDCAVADTKTEACEILSKHLKGGR